MSYMKGLGGVLSTPPNVTAVMYVSPFDLNGSEQIEIGVKKYKKSLFVLFFHHQSDNGCRYIHVYIITSVNVFWKVWISSDWDL